MVFPNLQNSSFPRAKKIIATYFLGSCGVSITFTNLERLIFCSTFKHSSGKLLDGAFLRAKLSG
ncbi:hypothetical protein MNBD_ALPHA11-817 [hydrothermal vent metagenome]|uniref:Uncharacterized protein n=1 Tax=hydrothermal vent metagenome TaxID=652676 RepID=A0A3B0UHD3_9ZZZZ